MFYSSIKIWPLGTIMNNVHSDSLKQLHHHHQHQHRPQNRLKCIVEGSDRQWAAICTVVGIWRRRESGDKVWADQKINSELGMHSTMTTKQQRHNGASEARKIWKMWSLKGVDTTNIDIMLFINSFLAGEHMVTLTRQWYLVPSSAKFTLVLGPYMWHPQLKKAIEL